MKHSLRNIARAFGVEIKRYIPANSHSLQLIRCLNQLGTDLVLDIGANKGQFAQELRSAGYAGQIVSFEPLQQEHAILQSTAKRDELWSVYDRGAIGSENGTVKINVSANSVSSSILPILKEHVDAAEQSEYVSKEEVQIWRLDSIAKELVGSANSAFLKIDTQGFEKEVLEGAIGILPQIRGLLCELSLQPLYEGQTLWRDMVDFLGDAGFELWAVQTGFTDARTGRTLQMDGVFMRDT